MNGNESSSRPLGPGTSPEHPGEDSIDLAARIDRLLDDALLSNHFQPIVDLTTRTVFAYEALCRPHDAHFAGPRELVTAAARCGRIGAVGRLQRTLAVAECSAWPLFLNIEPNEFDEPFLVRPDDPIFRHRKPVFLEITESVPISFFTQCHSILAEIREKGVLLAIDDLGAGFSNLQYISDLEPDIVKLDRELIHGCTRSSRSFLLLRSMTRLCHDMDARIIAEGIETEEELAAVLEAEVDYGQGYFLARPSSPPPELVWPEAIAAGGTASPGDRGERQGDAHALESQLRHEIRELESELAESEYRRESLAGRLKVKSHTIRELEGRIAQPLPRDELVEEPATPAAVSAPPARRGSLAAVAIALAAGILAGWALAALTASGRPAEPPAVPFAPALPAAEPQSARSAPARPPAQEESRTRPTQRAHSGSARASAAESPPDNSLAAAAVVQRLGNWTEAWSAQDSERYLAAYSPRFATPGGVPLAAWQQERRRRILSPTSISVTLTELEIVFERPDLARAVFTQFYESPGYSDQVRKTLGLALEDGTWLIINEGSEPLANSAG